MAANHPAFPKAETGFNPVYYQHTPRQTENNVEFATAAFSTSIHTAPASRLCQLPTTIKEKLIHPIPTEEEFNNTEAQAITSEKKLAYLKNGMEKTMKSLDTINRAHTQISHTITQIHRKHADHARYARQLAENEAQICLIEAQPNAIRDPELRQQMTLLQDNNDMLQKLLDSIPESLDILEKTIPLAEKEARSLEGRMAEVWDALAQWRALARRLDGWYLEDGKVVMHRNADGSLLVSNGYDGDISVGRNASGLVDNGYTGNATLGRMALLPMDVGYDADSSPKPKPRSSARGQIPMPNGYDASSSPTGRTGNGNEASVRIGLGPGSCHLTHGRRGGQSYDFQT